MVKNKKMKYEKSVPKGMTIKEASEYWDEHSFFDFDDVDEVGFEVKIKGEKHYILLDGDVAEQIEKVARRNKRSRHAIVNSLLKKTLADT